MTTRASGEGGFNGSSKSSPQDITISGAEWYSQQAHRAVNQAIGRVIRHRFDYGAILFLDSRFGEPRNQIGISKWIRPSFEPDKGVGPAIGSLVRFYRGAQKKVDAKKEADKGIRKPAINLIYENDEEGKEVAKRKEDGLGDSITKVSFIKTSTNEDQSSNGAYVRPDRITKQVQLNAQDNGINTSRGRTKNETTTEAKIRRRLQLQKMQNQPTKTDKEVKQKKANAERFYALAMKCLSPPDLADMKKNIVKLQSFGKEKDSKSYFVQARKLVEIFMRYDPCRVGGQTEKKSDLLVEFFLPVLPPAYLYSVEKMACQVRYDNSILKDECMKALKPEECQILHSKFPPLMINQDRTSKEKNGKNERRNKNSYFGDYQAIIKTLYDNDKDMRILRHLYPLIPKKQIAYVRTLVNDYKSACKIKAMKDHDKKRYGEDGINTALYQKPVENWITGAQADTSEKKMEDVIEMKQALFRAGSLNKDKNDKFQQSWDISRSELLNQNMKRKKSDSRQDNRSSKSVETKKSSLFAIASVSAAARPSKRAKSIMNFTMKTKNSKDPKPSSSSTSIDPLDQCLEVAKHEMYRKAAPRIISMSRVKSNAPQGMTCSICNARAQKVSQRNDFIV